jgi:adenylate cyclase
LEVQEAASAKGSSDLLLRIGINLGDIIIEPDGDIYGDGVNLATRLEQTAAPGGICISDEVHRHIHGRVERSFEDMGEQHVKNIARPVRVYALSGAPQADAVPKRLMLPDKPSIAILPFTNMSGDPEQEYFADGVVEDIITALSRFKWLFVIARNSSFTYKGRAVDVKQVGRELGVRYVLEGSIRKASQRIRITGQLIDAASGSHLWADRFDGALDDIFQLQDDVSASVANAVAPKMEQVETERANRKPLQHLGAYDLLLRARATYQGNSWRPAGGLADIDKAHNLLLQALELDPEFGPAYAAAASSFSVRKANQWVVDQAREVEETDRFARAVGRFAADDPAALCMAGSALAHVVRDIDAGTRYTDRALALAPNLAIANLYGALVCMWRGDAELAIARLTRAMRLSPLDPMLFAMQDIMALAHFQASRYAEAVFWAEASLADQPNDPIASRILAASHALTGEVQQAQRALKKLLHLVPTLRISNLRDILGPYPPEVMARQEHGLRLAGLPE